MCVIPIGALIAVLSMPATVPEHYENTIFISHGTLGHSTGNPYLRANNGGTYRLFCPQISLDRHRRHCFVDNIWEMQGLSVIVTHEKPIEWGVPKVVACDITDTKGKSLLREELRITCRQAGVSAED